MDELGDEPADDLHDGVPGGVLSADLLRHDVPREQAPHPQAGRHLIICLVVVPLNYNTGLCWVSYRPPPHPKFSNLIFLPSSIFPTLFPFFHFFFVFSPLLSFIRLMIILFPQPSKIHNRPIYIIHTVGPCYNRVLHLIMESRAEEPDNFLAPDFCPSGSWSWFFPEAALAPATGIVYAMRGENWILGRGRENYRWSFSIYYKASTPPW